MGTRIDARATRSPRRWYELLVMLYPPAYRARHREELLQNFEDLNRDVGSKRLFLAFITGDFIKSLTSEYMHYIKNHKWTWALIAIVIAGGAFGVQQVVALQKAHSSFANYAAFRGCETVTSSTDTQGTCVTGSGETVTIVKYENRWFLQGDLPQCFIGIGSTCLVDWP